MSRVFVIPDVHLKSWMFEKASELILKGNYDAVVMLGDLVDDWYQEKNIDLYNEIFDAAIAFTCKHSDTFWCYGNHDVSYLWEAMESGYSYYARETVVKRIQDLKNSIPPENSGFIHKIDNVVFSHAGLTERFVLRHFGGGQADLDSMKGNLLTLDNFSAYRDGCPIGDERFVWIDTIEKTWRFVEEKNKGR